MKRNTLFNIFFSLKRHRYLTKFLVFLFSIFFLVLSFFSVRFDTPTDDEPAHIVTGYIKLKYGYFAYYPGQMPLIESIIALPLMFKSIQMKPLWETNENYWGVGTFLLYHTGKDPDQLLLISRLPIVALWFFMLLLVFKWVKEVTNDNRFALLGFLMAGFCPNLMAHGHVATVDLGTTFFITISIYWFLKFLYKPSYFSSLVAGTTLAGALLSKISTLLLLPYVGFVFLIYLIWQSKNGEINLSWTFSYLPKAITLLLGVIFVIEAFYLLEMQNSYIQLKYPEISNSLFNKILIPWYEYYKEIIETQRWANQPYKKPQFFCGEYSFIGWWYYFPVTFILKTPLGTIILLALSVSIFPFIWRIKTKLSLRENKAIFQILACALYVVLNVGVAASANLNIGIRHILSIYPFIYVLISITLWLGFRRINILRSQAGIFFVCLALLWSFGSSLWRYPSYIGYFNELIGSHRNADKYLIDSNLDWGQDLRRLAFWVEQNNIEKINVRYFGGGIPEYYLKNKYATWTSTLDKKSGYYAISRHIYRSGSFYKDSPTDYVKFFEKAKYITTIGDSIYIFYVD